MINLFERNFDIENQRTQRTDVAVAAEAAAELAQKLEAARQEGFDAGRRVGRQDAEAEQEDAATQRAMAARAAITEQLTELVRADDDLRVQAERDIVEMFIGVAERLVPELLDSYGVDLAIERLRQSLALARTNPVLMIRACPDVIGALRSEAPDWLVPTGTNPQIDLRADAAMNRGAVQVHWQGGRLDYDLHAACLEMLKALAEARAEFATTSAKAG